MGIKEDMQDIIDYLKDFNEVGFENGKEKIKNVEDWLNSPYCPLIDEEELEDLNENLDQLETDQN